MPYLTVREKSKATKLRFSRLLWHPARKREWGLFWDTTHPHIFTYLLTVPGPAGDFRKPTYALRIRLRNSTRQDKTCSC